MFGFRKTSGNVRQHKHKASGNLYKYHIQSLHQKKPVQGNRFDLSGKRRTLFGKIRFIKIPFLLFLIAVSGVVLFASPVFKVKAIETERTNIIIDPSEIEVALGEQAIGQNIFLINTGTLEKYLQDKFSEWKSIEIKRVFPSTLLVSIKNYEVYSDITATIREENKKTNTTTETTTTFKINELGNITYDEMETKSPFKIIYADILDASPALGDNLVKKEHIEKINDITEKLIEDYELAVKEVKYFKKGKEAHFDLFHFTLWFDLTQDVNSQFKKLSQALQLLNKNNLEYIDLRISKRIIYKPKNEEEKYLN